MRDSKWWKGEGVQYQTNGAWVHGYPTHDLYLYPCRSLSEGDMRASEGNVRMRGGNTRETWR